jgi:hypothetical protein
MKDIYLIIAVSILLFAGCYDPHSTHYVDNTAPRPPAGLSAFNGDGRVDLTWIHNGESDLAGYRVYYSTSLNGSYNYIASTGNNYFVDAEASNGNVYYYAVTAYDNFGNESKLSKDIVYAAPRPEGYNHSIFNYRNFPRNGGYSFYSFGPVPFDDEKADFFFENYNGRFYLNVWDDSDIKDMGLTRDIYDIEFAPTSGWSASKDVEAREGNTYVIWTWDNHFAKVRIKSLTRDRVVFDWAFQLVKGEKLLKPKAVPEKRVLSRKETR